MAFTEEQGINAIIKLQEFNNIEETEETAKVNWNSMSDNEKLSTEGAFRAIFPEKEKS